jgi:hypothetical protein
VVDYLAVVGEPLVLLEPLFLAEMGLGLGIEILVGVVPVL